MNPITFSTFICLVSALICSAYSPSEHGGENAVNYRYNAGAGLKVQVPCNLGRGTYGAGSLSVKNISPSAMECLCKLKNSEPESEDNKSFQYFVKVSGMSPANLECESQSDEGIDVDVSVNVKLGFIELPCSVGTNSYWLGYWTKQNLGTSVVQCLCELANTRIVSFIMKPYDFFVEKTGINLYSLHCDQKNDEEDDPTSAEEDDESTPAPSDEKDDSTEESQQENGEEESTTPAPAEENDESTPAPSDENEEEDSTTSDPAGEDESTPPPSDKNEEEDSTTSAPAEDDESTSAPNDVNEEEDSTTPAPAEEDDESTPALSDDNEDSSEENGEEDSTTPAPAEEDDESTPAPSDENEEEDSTTPAPAEENDETTPAPTNSAPAEQYSYNLDYTLTYLQKYDFQSYLTSSKYTWNWKPLLVNFIEGINESNQPKFGVALVNAIVNNEKWTVENFPDLSLCKKYPENSLYSSLQKTLSQLIFEQENGCSIEPGTNVTIPRRKTVSITIDEKISCGLNALNIVLQSPDNSDALGLYWTYNLPFSSDCIDYSIEEEREKDGVKKAFISTPFENVTRDVINGGLLPEVTYFEYDRFAPNEYVTWFAFPKGFDAESPVVFWNNPQWRESYLSIYASLSSNITGPCSSEAVEFSLDDVFLHIFKHFAFGGKDCPIESGTNITVSMEYPDMEARSYDLLPCGHNTVFFYLNQNEGYIGQIAYLVGSWNVPNTTQCVDYSTY